MIRATAIVLALAAGVPVMATGAATAAKVDGLPAPMSIESAFSPYAQAQALVLKVIASASSDIRLAAYSFSSPAVLAAKQRGVDVRVLADYRRNRKRINLDALDALAGAGIAVRTIDAYAMHHDKYMVVDGQTVQNGSFNYTHDAAVANSENVLVVWHNVPLAQSYIAHWESRWQRGKDYRPQPLTGSGS